MDTSIIKDRILLSDIISKKVKLTKKGQNFVGLCPFHSEKTPSFNVNDEKGFYHCFGCGESGDVIEFVRKTDNLEFQDALEYLAKIAGINISQTPKEHNYIHYSLNLATKWFTEQLKNCPTALQYLYDRQISDEIIKKFKIGYAPNQGLKKYLLSQNISLKIMREVSLIKHNDNDYFYNRIIFPIQNSQGNVIAFGGRIIDEKQHPKYLNSAESSVFKKNHHFYGLNLAINEARKQKNIIVVEGYMDVLMLHKLGIFNVVGLLGTAISFERLETLWKHVPEITIFMDGDSAGQTATVKAAKLALKEISSERTVKFIIPPTGQDPYDLCKNYSIEYIKNLIKNRNELSYFIWEYVFNQMQINPTKVLTPEQQLKLESKLAQYVKLINNNRIARYYERFFEQQIRNLRGYQYNKKSKLTTSSDIDFECLNSLSQQQIIKQYIDFSFVYFILKFPELLDDHIFENNNIFDIFSNFHIEANDNLLELQRQIINIKHQHQHQHQEQLTHDILLIELEKNNFHNIANKILKDEKHIIVDVINPDAIVSVKKNLEKIILLNQMYNINQEIENATPKNDLSYINQLLKEKESIDDKISKLFQY